MALKYYGGVFFLLLIPALTIFVGPAASILSVALLPVVLVGAEYLAPRWAAAVESDTGLRYSGMPMLYIVLQLVVTAWATWWVERVDTSTMPFIALVFSVGVVAGVFAMMAAHVGIHSHNRGENILGVLMLTGMSYRHFRIAHIYGHHRYAATERDAATARFGESYFSFLPRTILGQFKDAWTHEDLRRHRLGKSILTNRVVGDAILMLLLYGAIGLVLGPRAVLFFGIQSAIAIAALELFNYVAHYGLRKEQGETFSDKHSWNASHAVNNAVLFNMGRHSDHHRRAAAPYQTLRPMADGPELPAGYAGAMLLALIPPLWRKLMDPRVSQLRPQPAE